MRRNVLCTIAVLGLMLMVPVMTVFADSDVDAEDRQLSGHAQNADIEVTYQGGSPLGQMYIRLTQTPVSDVRLIVTSPSDVQTIDRLPGEKNLTVLLKPLLEQTYTVLIVNAATNVDIAQIDIVIGYNTTYTVTLKAGDGSGSDIIAEVVSGGAFLFPYASFTAPSGKVFDSWSVSGRSYYADDVIKVNGDITATAQWRAPVDVTVSFQPGEGSGSMPTVSVKEGSQYTLPKSSFSSPSGKEFAGWLYNGEVQKAGSSITIVGNTVLVAQWQEASSGDDMTLVIVALVLVIALAAAAVILFMRRRI